MNCVLHNGGVSPNQQRKSPIVSHGMLQAQQQPPQHTVTSEKQMLPNQYLPANLAAKPLLANPPSYQMSNQLSMNANAALFAQQQAQAQLIAQQNLLAHHQQATAASVSPMSSFALIPHSAANSIHHHSGSSGLAVAQSPLMTQTNPHHHHHHQLAQHMQQHIANLTQPTMQSSLVSNLMSRTASYQSNTLPTPPGVNPQSITSTGITSQGIPFTLSPGLQFATFPASMNPYTNQMLLSPHSLASLQLKSPQAQAPQARTFAAPSHAHTLQQHHHPQHHHHHHAAAAAAAMQQMNPMSAHMTNFQHLSMNANAAAATTLMHSIKRSYESAFHQDPSASIHHQKRPTQFTGTGIL